MKTKIGCLIASLALIPALSHALPANWSLSDTMQAVYAVKQDLKLHISMQGGEISRTWIPAQTKTYFGHLVNDMDRSVQGGLVLAPGQGKVDENTQTITIYNRDNNNKDDRNSLVVVVSATEGQKKNVVIIA